MEDVVYTCTILCHPVFIYFFFKNCRPTSSLKYIIIPKGLLTILTAAAEIALRHPECFPEKYCSWIALVNVASISLAWLMLTYVVIIMLAEMTFTQKPRSLASVLLVLLSSFLFSITLLSPFMFLHADGHLLLRCPVAARHSHNNTAVYIKFSLPLFNAVSYISFFIIFQFVIPDIIIMNRLVLILYNSICKTKQRELDPSANGAVTLNAERAVNFVSVATASVCIFLYIQVITFKDNEPETLQFLAEMFEVFSGLSVLTLSFFPIFCLVYFVYGLRQPAKFILKTNSECPLIVI